MDTFDISLKYKSYVKMNASSWRKAADLIAQGTQPNQQIHAAATADSSQLESLLLSSLAADDSGPPQVNYGTEQPLAVSTPRAITTPAEETQPTDTYQQIIPGVSECLYPTLRADGSLSTPASEDCSTLHKQTMPLTLKKPPAQQNWSLMSKTPVYNMIILPIARPHPGMS